MLIVLDTVDLVDPIISAIRAWGSVCSSSSPSDVLFPSLVISNLKNFISLFSRFVSFLTICR